MDLILFDNAKRAVAQLMEFDEIKEHMDKAAALVMYAQRAKDRELEIKAAEYRSYCEHRAGGMLTAERGRPTKINTGVKLTARNADIEPMTATRFRQFAEVPEESVTEATEVLKGQGIPPTRKRIMDVHYSSESSEHYTPDHILELVFPTMGDVDLDPCADAGKSVAAQYHFTEKDDGLSQEWFGRVFMNPPYGRAIKDWVLKLQEEFETKRVEQAIALVPARVDTEWFSVLDNYPVCFVRGRLTFKGNRDPAPFPSAIFYLGRRTKTFIRQFGGIGTVWTKVS